MELNPAPQNPASLPTPPPAYELCVSQPPPLRTSIVISPLELVKYLDWDEDED